MTMVKRVKINSNQPLVQQLNEEIKRRFVLHAEPGKRLPTEYELAAEYEVNRMAVRRAFEQLSREGYVYRRPRHGTFVSNIKKKLLHIVCYQDRIDTDNLFSLFRKTHQDVELEINNISPGEDYHQRTRELATEGRADVVRLTGALFNQFDAENSLLALNREVKKLRSECWDGPWKAYLKNRSYYGVPFGCSMMVMVYRKDLFRKAGVSFPKSGWTWQDFLNLAVRLTGDNLLSTGNKQYGFLFSSRINRWAPFIYQAGGKILPNGSAPLVSREASQALNFIFSLLHVHRTSPVSVGHLDAFLRTDTAMTICSCRELADLREKADFPWGIAELPREKKQKTLMIVDGFAVMQNTREKEAALKFLEFTISPECQKLLGRNHQILPITRKVAAPPILPGTNNFFNKLRKYAVHQELPYSGEKIKLLEKELDLFWSNLQNYKQLKVNLVKSWKECK